MAYVTKEKLTEVRTKLKKQFPNIKFSVTQQNHMVLVICVMKSNIDFSDLKNNKEINIYSLNQYKQHTEFFQKLVNIVMAGNHNNSDTMTDYYDVGWYVTLRVGKYDKDHILENN